MTWWSVEKYNKPRAFPWTCKEEENLQACLDQCHHFSSLVVSCGGVLVKEPNCSSTTNLAGSLAKKSGKSYSETTNFMKSRMSIALERVIPTSQISQHPQWKLGTNNKHISNWINSFTQKMADYTQEININIYSTSKKKSTPERQIPTYSVLLWWRLWDCW